MEDAHAVCAFLGCGMDTVVTLSGSVCIQSYEYKPNCMVVVDWNDEGPHYAKVKVILVFENKVNFVLHPWHTMHYNRHLHAYSVAESQSECVIKQPQELKVCRPFHVTKCHGKDDQSWYIVAPFNII